ncbi:MAG: hypothetical protein Q4D98_14440 [Planctomycetia bacterium]|nr:hypothetical protein [Planctomycetia bacterium]
MKKIWLLGWVLVASFVLAEEGKRPYEMEWAGRVNDDVPPLADFEGGDAWTVETTHATASFAFTNEQKIWGEKVGKLTYRYLPDEKNSPPTVVLRPPKPIPLNDTTFDMISCWIYGNNWAWVTDASTPRVEIRALFRLPDGKEFFVPLTTVQWKEWFVPIRVLNEWELENLHQAGTCFNGFAILNGWNTEDRTLYFDNFAIRKEAWKPLTFQPRARRGVIFPEQDPGLNTGKGKLPFPTREATILPDNLCDDYENIALQEGETFTLKYVGKDGTLEWRYRPKMGHWSDWTASWNGGVPFYPCSGGGVFELANDAKTSLFVMECKMLKTTLENDKIISVWELSIANEGISATVEYRFSLRGKTLVAETFCKTPNVAYVQYGHLLNFSEAKAVPLPYYSYAGYSEKNRPAVICFRDKSGSTLFFMGNTDWYAGNGSLPVAEYNVDAEANMAWSNRGVRYLPKTDGTRNPCYERFFLSISPRMEEVLPNIPNPPSPWKQITGTKQWRSHGAGDREGDKKFWYRVWRYGLREVVVTDHEVCWRDGGESFTFRTRAAPGKGGDEGMRDYARYMQDTLGFVYGPYNNFTDFAPVNEYWSTDMVSRFSDGKLQPAWARCYAPKPARAVEYCEKLSPINQEKFRFSTAYCDVHTSVTPWSRTDFDARVPGAGTWAATFYPYGEIMLIQKKAWNGPVYSEGPQHAFYAGLTDGNYAQDQGYKIPFRPWLVDFDLRKIHPLECDFGMGNLGMFYPRGYGKDFTPKENDAMYDRFFAATLAFGHPGFLCVDGGVTSWAMRGYYLLLPLHTRYTQTTAKDILYIDDTGKAYAVSEAVANDAYRRSQLVVKYADGTVVCANGSESDPMNTTVDGREISLPPTGFTGWTADGTVFVFSGLKNGSRCDYAESPDAIFLDGRGTFRVFDKACGKGCGVCRKMDATHWEFLPHSGTDMGFRIDATHAVALDYDGKELGPATLRQSRGFTYVVPVEGAFSYRLTLGKPVENVLKCDRWNVLPGEKVTVEGAEKHPFTIPENATPGTTVWAHFENAWLDFRVVSLANVTTTLDENRLCVRTYPNIPEYANLTVTLGDQTVSVENNVASFALPTPEKEGSETLELTFAAGEKQMKHSVATEIVSGYKDFSSLWKGTEKHLLQIRGQSPSTSFDKTGGHVSPGETTLAGVKRVGFLTHPPHLDGRGCVLTEFSLTLPELPTVLDAFVGKRTGSDMGDGIFYKINIVAGEKTTTVAETSVLVYEWRPLSADLTPWAGQTVRLQIVTDCGPENNTHGDWGVWGDLNLRSRDLVLRRQLIDN